MKKLLLLTFFNFSITFAFAQTICIQRGNTTLIETRLDTAIVHAQSGDIIYLPGGLVPPGSFNINKKLRIIGCGYRLDSSGATQPTLYGGGINFNTGSDSSFITGIYLTSGSIIFANNVSNCSVTRCNFKDITFNNGCSNIFIVENIIRGNFIGSINSTSIPFNITFSKNVIYGYNWYSFGNYNTNFTYSIFSNNNFLSNPSNNLFNGITLSNIYNNVFLHVSANFSPGSGNIYYNNLFVADSLTISAGSTLSWNNYYLESATNIFVNYTSTSGVSWSLNQNFHLKPGCHGIGLGNDGTDAGIYGTVFPFKDAGTPYNPHYQLISIPPAPDSSGNLNININVKTQTY